MAYIELIVWALTAILIVVPAASVRGENVVRWVSAVGMIRWEPTNLDDPTSTGLAQVYEGLTLTDSDLTLHPALATDWVLVRPDMWRFHLRPGVRFHDGTTLTARDVAFSLERGRGKGSDYAIFITNVAAVTATADDTVEITTKRPDLLLPVKLRRMPIIPEAWALRHGAALPARLDDSSAYTFAHANGTGPFMLESFEPGRRTVLVRNPNWWGSAAYPRDIDRIVWTIETDPERRLALLVGGEADFLQDPPLDRLDRLRNTPGIKLTSMDVLSTVFLGLDLGSAELRTSDVKGRNPFADRRVRQAVYQAIDVAALVTKAVNGLGKPAGMMTAPGTNGYDPELDRRLPYDPERARALLAEAGYPGGFAVRLDCPPHRRSPCEEIAAQLAGVGLRVVADIPPYPVFRQRVTDRASDFYLSADHPGMTLDSGESFHDLYYQARPHWLAAPGYADPVTEGLIERIDGEVSTPVRDALIDQTWRRVLDDIVVVPLYHTVWVWAMRDWLDVPPHALPWPLFRQARLATSR
ncbi:ABC transporter substrate-binding protein [Benzoatithermus flavus]|uniref:ABC transporter substrate-binding protein n=1 Tax=Benzoatithermus flavus TaxID=3108223 RepID=A0ABU8XTV9_9PROT